jgi:hypothetical protein
MISMGDTTCLFDFYYCKARRSLFVNLRNELWERLLRRGAVGLKTIYLLALHRHDWRVSSFAT